MLNAKKSFTEIAQSLGKDKSTISKEIRAHVEYIRTGAIGVAYNACKNRYNCKRTGICPTCNSPRKFVLCRKCSMCNMHCPNFEKEDCPRHSKPPYVCNGCGKRSFCTLEKKVYLSNSAHEEYRALLINSRTGGSLSEEDLLRLDRLISPLIRQGQSPHHVYVTNDDSIMVSERTIYRLIDSRSISAMNLDLPRKMKFKARRKKKEFKVDKACRIGRDFNCFLKFMEENPDLPVTQLDSVEGKKGGKVLLTIHFVKCEMMLAFLRDANTAKSVSDIFDSLYEELGDAEFESIFKVCLADNGSEFSNPAAIEFAQDGSRRSHLFYCDPQAPFQKPRVEENHTLIRRILPKGSSFDSLAQLDIDLVMSHVNSYRRASLSGKSPLELFSFLYGEQILSLFPYKRINPNDIILRPSLLK